ncbi:MAG: LarC family nickel insertion protein [Candidatus Omnitrophica bacterium]|nr:LarC family nickel insertion protein [Candidatus Omnitrophota bacterium]
MFLYFDIVGGASGDMLLSSLIGLGFKKKKLVENLNLLGINYKIKEKEIKFSHTELKRAYFSYSPANYSYKEIVSLINKANLPNDIKLKVLSAYEFIFKIEKKVHRAKGGSLKFEHLGEPDAILEITGFFLGLKYLNVDKFFFSTIPLSQPAPVTLEILKGKLIKPIDLGYESITPTAALLLSYGEQREDVISFDKFSISYGDYSPHDYLVAYMGGSHNFDKDTLVKIETTLDDVNPQIFELLFDSLFKEGAKEVYLEQVIVKKSRPGFVLNILCEREKLEPVKRIIFNYTSTFGLRYQFFLRDKLPYKFLSKNTPWGKIRFRISLDKNYPKCIPEYEDCKRISQKFGLPIIEVFERLKRA